MERYSDRAIEIINELHTARIDYENEYIPLIDCANQCAAYEDTGMTPEAFQSYVVFLQDLIGNQKASEALDRFRQLVKADRAGRLAVLPSNKALTNADRMRTATNQQLAKLLYDNQKEFCRLMYKNLGFEDELEFSEDYSDILAWLNTSEKAEKVLEAMKDG